MGTLLHGMLLGFAVAAPVGPLGVLCIQRTLASGWWAGMLAGLGTATADAVYGLLAVSGATLVTHKLIAQQAWIRLFGGLLLLVFAVTALRTRTAASAAAVRPQGPLSLYASTFLLTLTSPLTILSFVAVVASAGIAGDGRAGAVLVLGFFLGSASWWALLSGVVSVVRHRLSSRALRAVNVGSGMVLLAFALYAVVTGLLLVRA
ncbi:LysE family translocator [Deinococcus aquiradiocola]|nr:LysE family transporter [Deinococcus aquiradiocola]